MTTIDGDSVTDTESREDIPLRRIKKSRGWYSCNEDDLSGTKFLNVAFGSITFVITVALLVQIYYGYYQVVPHGSVATDALECSEIGTSILKKGGNAVDASIASTFCLAVAAPHVTGLDAHGLLLTYNHRARLLPNVIDFSSPTVVSKNLPRLVLGLAYIHQQFGSLAWKNLVEPAADLARKGFLISRMLVQAVTNTKAVDLFGRLEAGQILRHENLDLLAVTLDKIANMPGEELYSYITNTNTPTPTQALKSSFNNYNLYVPNNSSIGPFVVANLQEIEKFNFTKEDTVKSEFVYRLAETTQMAYLKLNINENFHEGTSSNVAAMDLDDNYVSLVTGMYDIFGSKEMTTHGYILDVKDKDKPCSRLPFIITDSKRICGRRMVFGATNVAEASQLITSLLIAKENAIESIEAPRFHILSNGTIGIEGSHLPSFNEDTLQYLKTLTSDPVLVREPYHSSNIVEKVKDDLMSHSDSRGGGIASRF